MKKIILTTVAILTFGFISAQDNKEMQDRIAQAALLQKQKTEERLNTIDSLPLELKKQLTKN